MSATRFTGGKSAFTLVEMLVSVTVLLLIMAFVSQLMNSTTLSTKLSGNHGNADNQARLVFDRMAEDFAGMPRRTDIDFIFSKQPDPAVGTPASNDKMYFYSMAPGYYDSTAFNGSNASQKEPTALIGYTMYTGSNSGYFPTYSLLRLSKGLTWNSSQPTASPGGMLFLTIPGPGSLPLAASSLPGTQSQPNWNGVLGFPPDYDGSGSKDFFSYNDVLSNEVLRMEFCFQVKDLTKPSSPGSAYSNYPVANFGTSASNKTTVGSTQPAGPNIGDRWYDTAHNRAYLCANFTSTGSGTVPVWTPNGLSDVTAIIVGLAVLDTSSRKVASAHLADISAALADPAQSQLQPPAGTSPQLMADLWNQTINQSTFASTVKVPQITASQVRVYQRFFYLNNL